MYISLRSTPSIWNILVQSYLTSKKENNFTILAKSYIVEQLGDNGNIREDLSYKIELHVLYAWEQRQEAHLEMGAFTFIAISPNFAFHFNSLPQQLPASSATFPRFDSTSPSAHSVCGVSLDFLLQCLSLSSLRPYPVPETAVAVHRP